jgi:chromosomal replication initiation ATPase DnaA
MVEIIIRATADEAAKILERIGTDHIMQLETKREAKEYDKIPAMDQIEFILQTVCDGTRISREKMKSDYRGGSEADARKYYYYLCYFYTNATFYQISSSLGGRHHSTVISGKNTAIDFIKTDPLFKTQLMLLEEKVEDKLSLKKEQ